MKKKIIKFASILSLVLSLAVMLGSPAISLAQPTPSTQFGVPDQGGGRSYPDGSSSGTVGCNLTSNPKLQDLIGYVTCIISKYIVGLLFAVAFVFFLWGMVQFIGNADNESERDKGKQFMIWGIIGITVMFCVWGLVAILTSTFNINTKTIPQLPQAPGQ